MSEPNRKIRKRDSSTETDEETTVEVSVLASINSKLAILELLHIDIRDLKASLEFSQSQIETLMLDNIELKKNASHLSTQVTKLTKENQIMQETILDIQCRSMRDNLIFSGINIPPQNTSDDPEKAIREFMHDSLKLPAATVEEITFHRVHRLPSKDPKKPPPIIVKFEKYKHKELVKSRGNQLKNTTYGMYDQFPKQIQDRRRKLVPMMKRFREEGKRATLSVDKLYVDGTLYRDPNITTWLYPN